MLQKIENSIVMLEKWLQENDYEGFEPYDGLLSFIRLLTFGNCLAERILEQVVLRCPFHIRPLLGVKASKSSSGMGLLARGYLKMWVMTENKEYKNKAVYCLDWLINNYSPGYSGHCWGLNYDHTSRSGTLPKHVPNVVSTSIIGQAFLDGYEIFENQQYLQIASSICNFILKDLPHNNQQTGICINYHPNDTNYIHNANMLAAAILAGTSKFTGDKTALKIAKEAMEYSCSKQRLNGAWYYGEATKYQWIDNFHTGYNLYSLKCYIDCTNDTTFEENLSRGYKYYKETFFETDGRAKYYNNQLYPIDIQCISQAIDTLTYFSEYDNSAIQLAFTVADWAIRNMQDISGYFYYRKLRWKKVKVPMVRWGQATMFCALNHLLIKAKKVDRNLHRNYFRFAEKIYTS